MTRPPTIDPDALTLDGIRTGALADRAVTVLGFARSGIALARFLADVGARVTIYDARPASELGPAIAALGGRTATLALGPDVDPATTWAETALVTSSPAINADYPTTEPRLRSALRSLAAARAAGDPEAPAVVSEADLFLRLCPAPTVGVTGTKGKTTTSALIATILGGDPTRRTVQGGNMGLPLIERLVELTPDDRVVDELSELQLPTLSRGTTVAVYTNVTSDHLDRHGTLERYRGVKRRLAELIDPVGALILNADDPVVASFADGATVSVIWYTRGTPAPGGVGIVDGWIVASNVERLAIDAVTQGPSTDGPILPIAELAVPGDHNVSNALAAVAVGLLFAVPPDIIRESAASFRGVEHRLETVSVVDGIRFVNDSQGTQPDAVIAALRAFEPPIVLIAGGRDKGVDLSALGPEVAERVAAAVLIGESGPALEARFQAAGLATTMRAGSMDEAVRVATTLARDARDQRGASVATVLLSPAAASFDMFTDYADRGAAFKRAVAGRSSHGLRSSEEPS